MEKEHKRHKAEHKKHMKSCAFCVSGLKFFLIFGIEVLFYEFSQDAWRTSC